MYNTNSILASTFLAYILYFSNGTNGLPTKAENNRTHTTTYSPNYTFEGLGYGAHNSTFSSNQTTNGFNGGPYTTTESPNNQPVEDSPEGFQGSRDPANDTKRYIVIDDMIIKKDTSRAGVVNLVWPKGEVPYLFHMSVAPQQRVQIAQAMTDISTVTCVQFRPAKNEDSYSLQYQSDPRSQGCSSYVGWQNKKAQPIQLAQVCSHGNVVHEIIHALGFFHEQTRNDRDDYVKINFENIQPGYEGNFKKEKDMDPAPNTETYDVPYNYDSIMHYGRTFFSKNNQPTIEVLNNTNALGRGENIGQRNAMSPGDIRMINTKYNCPTVTGNPYEELTTTPTSETEATSAAPTTKPSNPMCQYIAC